MPRTDRTKGSWSLRSLFGAILILATSAAFAAEAPLPAGERIIPRAAITDKDCLDCHGVRGFAVPTGAHGDTTKRALSVDDDGLRDSVHGKLTCLACHDDIQRLPHGKEKMQRVDCRTCHKGLHAESPALLREIEAGRTMVGLAPKIAPTPRPANHYTTEYEGSVHGQPHKDDPTRRNAECKDCHGTHYVFPSKDSKALSHRLASPEVCGQCHRKALDLYRTSAHGAPLKTPWKGESATCGDCHSAHQITEAKGITARRLVTENCGDCHKEALASYLDTYHGQMAWLGGKDVAKCSDCHRPHDTRKVDDPTDKVHKNNLLATCRTCHKEATASFVQFQPHGNTHDFKKYPELWLIAKGMTALVVVVLLFFYSHSALWFRRSRQERVAGALHHEPPSGRHVQRFAWPWRLNHWLLALSVMTLVFTGMTAMYADAVWATLIADHLIRPETLALVHRVAAVCFLIAIIGHTVAVLHNVLVRKRGKFAWFGPDSLLPRWQDAKDMAAQFRWFFGKGEKPRFDRWTYWEKFDYWAVYWGAVVIGVSGLILWFPSFFGRYLPGWVFNVATVAHGVEAFLAVTTLFVVHFFNNHFRPGKFPLDTVMFVGSWTLEELKEERPEQYRRLVESGALEQRLVPGPSRLANIVSHGLGFALIGIGLMLLVLVTVGFFQRGLV